MDEMGSSSIYEQTTHSSFPLSLTSSAHDTQARNTATASTTTTRSKAPSPRRCSKRLKSNLEASPS
jgi:hypothetical protein